MKCPVCEGISFIPWGKTGDYTIVICSQCGLGITTPIPTNKDLLAVNQEIYQVDQRIQTYLSRRRYFENRYVRYIKKITRFKPSGRLLDVGCNIGLFLSVARNHGFSVTGVEMNHDCAEFARNTFHLEVFSDFLEQVSFKADSFDVVTLFDVLEHIPDINSFLVEVKRILKPGGLLVVQSPNIRSVMADITGPKWAWLSPPDHLYHFSPKSIELLMRSHGFKINTSATWEPARDFSENLITAFVKNQQIRSIMLIINAFTHIFTLPALLLQRLWWWQHRGALLELYAENS